MANKKHNKMKKLILICLIGLGSTLIINAQTEGWTESGGNTTTLNDVGIGTTNPVAIFHTEATGTATSGHTGCFINNLVTSSSAGIDKTGLHIYSTGTWNGTGAHNFGLKVTAADGTNNYAAIFDGAVGIGVTYPTSNFHTVASGAKTAAYTGNLFNTAATSSTNSINKIGVDIQSTGTWNGTSAINTGLNVNVSGGTTNYSAIFQGGNVGVGLTLPASLFHSAGQIRTGIPSGGLGGASATTGDLLFYNSSNTNTVNIQSGATTTTYSMTLPLAQGAASTVLTNNGSGVLSWTANNGSGWSLTGNSGTTAGTNFIGTTDAIDWVVKTNNSERMRVLSGGNVGIGTTAPGAKLEVQLASSGTALQAADKGMSLSTSTVATSNTTHKTSPYLYLSGAIWNGTVSTTRGWTFQTVGTSGVNYGHRLAIGSDDNQNVMSLTSTASGAKVGIGTTTPGYELEVIGDINASVNVRAAGVILTSDKMFKTNIDTISNALSIINKLKPRSYNWDTKNVYGMSFDNQKQYGLISQDVEIVLPELISNTSKLATLDSIGTILTPAVTYKGLNYIGFIAIMMKGIQEQQQTIDNLQNQLIQLANKINVNNTSNVDSKSLVEISQTNVELNDAQTIVLEQNVPNPFAEQTTISYSLPDNTVKAQMLFYNAQGKLIQTVALIQKGKGQLNVFANDLSSGIYSYTLVVDEIIIETKRMIKQ